MTIERREPSYDAAELPMLTGWLDYERATLAVKCDGLDETQLRERSVRPSTMSLLGLIRHMSEVERHWFRRVIAGEDAPPRYYSDPDDPDGDFDNVDDADVDEAFSTWRAECANSRAVTAAAENLDHAGTHRGQQVSLRWVLTHMIEEYARHNGHADLLRERIDGTVGE